MKVLVVTNMWPNKEHPYFGIFVKEQIQGLKKVDSSISIKLNFIDGRKNKLNYLFKSISIWLHLLKNRYDVVHVHYSLSGVFAFLPRIKSPIIYSMHGSDFKAKNKLVKLITNRLIKRANAVIYLNEEMRFSIEKLNDSIFHIPCGVDIDLFKPLPLSKGIDKKFKIAFPGNPNRPVKNYDLFRKIIDSLNIDVDVLVIHGLTREEVRDTLNDVDLLCMTSLSEGSPQIIKEAMACNCPIVSTDVGDVSHLLNEVNNCFVIKSFNMDEFKERIMSIIVQKKGMRKSSGREKILKLGIDERSTTKKLFDVYNRIKSP